MYKVTQENSVFSQKNYNVFYVYATASLECGIGEEELLEFTGSLPECESYINLKENANVSF